MNSDRSRRARAKLMIPRKSENGRAGKRWAKSTRDPTPRKSRSRPHAHSRAGPEGWMAWAGEEEWRSTRFRSGGGVYFKSLDRLGCAMDSSERQIWDRHWQSLGKESALFGQLASLVRKLVLRRAVEHYAEAYFPADGVFVDAGCGTGQASAAIPPRRRRLVGFDFS